MRKTIIFAVLLAVLTGCASSKHARAYMKRNRADYAQSITRERVQTELHSEAMEMLHEVWQNHKDVWAEVQNTEAYKRYDSICNKDWEDFYYEW